MILLLKTIKNIGKSNNNEILTREKLITKILYAIYVIKNKIYKHSLNAF